MFRFIDLFAGIGGMRIGFENLGGSCVFSSESDVHARKTYELNFNEIPSGDIREIDAEDIPKHNLLLAGFPCQPFSIAGVSKLESMGLEHGFMEETKGTLFFEICRVLEYHRPDVFLLENVKGLTWHDEGKTFKIILESLEELGYAVSWKVINSKNFVPQRRERIFIVGFKDGTDFEFWCTPLTMAEREQAMKGTNNDMNAFALRLFIAKALFEDGRRMFAAGQIDEMRHEVTAEIMDKVMMAILPDKGEENDTDPKG
mgnify:CR=1 FL=1